METETCLWCLRDCPINEFCTCEDGRRRMERTARGNLPRVGIRPPKPATTEPPEWKVKDASSLSLTRVSDFIGSLLDDPPAPPPLDRALDATHQVRCQGCNGFFANIDAFADHISGGSMCPGLAPRHKFQPSPLDRALEDFTARRKAKREHVPEREGILSRIRRVNAAKDVEAKAEPLARALSTPLPHDPDMHMRVMPWRGKE